MRRWVHGQVRLASLRARSGLNGDVPGVLAEVIADITAFADLILSDGIDAGGSWDPAERRWST